ncbi:hypothetical protein BKP45_19370 [Anaerobacillus alkalidiazotrophicus]|uniref:tRNA(Met) cytidine acetate ligase n=1 Tax=Anaerobacillus alkalidiazotrophicus TaxID=472963 RepID=A0A1S2LZP6_9BACI|nr:nucleotidyltransferase [Anaerobacillus alkalidiazotrophicus]OIJ17730.1 hypothetical protein BKP45_19370 [Anaerobacillus alkalidiazotrophicus]
MNVTGVVVEYNPFHNGHKLHINETKQITDADLIVAIMSGNFLQRGEPALISKWARTKMALNQGVDIVLELPYVYATQHAELFANGAISILNGFGANSVCFGSESGDIKDFHRLIKFINENETTYRESIRDALKKGVSYPKALSFAFKKLKNHNQVLDLSLPNNILGYQYVKAIYEQKANIKPFTIKRKEAQYHDKEIPKQSIASATSIRKKLVKEQDHLNSINHVVPSTTYDELVQYRKMYHNFQDWERLFPYLKYKVLTSSPIALANIYEAEEGLENRLSQTINEATSFQSLMEKIKTKRYTWTRLQRFCLHTLTNSTKEEMSAINDTTPYIRVLGMNQKGRKYINNQKKYLELPLISTISKINHPFINIEKRATSCYSLGYSPIIQAKLIKEEYAHPPVII